MNYEEMTISLAETDSERLDEMLFCIRKLHINSIDCDWITPEIHRELTEHFLAIQDILLEVERRNG